VLWEKEWLPTDFTACVCDIYVYRFNNKYEQILKFRVFSKLYSRPINEAYAFPLPSLPSPSYSTNVSVSSAAVNRFSLNSI